MKNEKKSKIESKPKELSEKELQAIKLFQQWRNQVIAIEQNLVIKKIEVEALVGASLGLQKLMKKFIAEREKQKNV